ncbi:hypothetical protein AMTRI_Chr09g42940 [Amborella trichopoda]
MSTPIDKKTKLSNKMCSTEDMNIRAMERVPYRSAVGSLMYAMTGTRLDLSFVMILVSRFQSNPGEEHWKAVKRILKYFLCTYIQRVTDPNDAKSTSGYVFMLGGGVVSWKPKKQDIVALSTMEAEYVACCLAAKEAVWIKKFLNQLSFHPVRCEAVRILCDNMAAICIFKELCFHKNSKHIKPYFYHLRNEVRMREIEISYISTDLMIADPLTKGVAPNVFVRHVSEMGMRESGEERM